MSKKGNPSEKWEKWLHAKQPVPKNEVAMCIAEFFPEVSQGKSSHEFKCSHPKLADHPYFAPNGGMTIPVTNGRDVKPVYLKRLAKAIQIIKEKEEEEKSEEK
jgi:hypothetical protein